MTSSASKRLLSREEQSRLVVAAQQGDQRAREQLIRRNDGFVWQVAKSVNRLGLADMEDILQVCRIGLNKAIDSFDPARGVHFLSHAVWQMEAEAKRELGKHLSTLSINPAIALKVFLGGRRHASDEHHHAAKEALRPTVSLQVPLVEGGQPLEELVADDRPASVDSLDEAQIQSRLKRALERALLQLSPREQYVLERRRLSEDHDTLGQIGAEFGLSRERIRQLEHRALAVVAEILRADADVSEVLA